MAVYDDQKTDDLKRLEEEGQLGRPSTDDSDDQTQASDQPEHDRRDLSDGDRKAEIASLEKGFAGNGGASDDKLGLGFNEEKDSGKKSRFSGLRRRRTLIGIGAGGGFIGLALLFFSTALPFKTVSIIQSLEEQAFANTTQAVGDMGENFFAHYLMQRVFPNLRDGICVTTADINCVARKSAQAGLVNMLYDAWADQKLEYKLATQHGFEIRREGTGSGAKFIIRTNKAPDADISRFVTGSFDGNFFLELNANDRQAIRTISKQAFEGETKWATVFNKYRTSKLMERKYGITRCIVACNLKDNINTSVENKKLAAKAFLASRVLYPNSELTAIAVECMLNNFSCADGLQDPADENGEKKSQYQKDVETRLAELRRTHGSENIEKALKDTEDLRRDGIRITVFNRLIGKTATDVLLKGIPIVGWIDLAISGVEAGVKGGAAIQTVHYILGSTAMVQLYAMYATQSDEIREGDTDATISGTFAEAFNANPDDGLGGASMTQSPLYQTQMLDAAPAAASLASLFGGSVSAAAADGQYVCNDGKSPAVGNQGNTVCQEEELGPNDALSGWAGYGGQQSGSSFTPFAQDGTQWLGPGFSIEIIQAIFDIAGNVVGEILNLLLQLAPEDFKIFISGVVSDMSKWIMEVVAPIGLKEVMGGAREYNQVAGGADVVGNQTAHYGIGGKLLTPTESAAIQQRRLDEKAYAFSQKSLTEKLFDKNDTGSFVSRVAVVMPSNNLATSLQVFASSLVKNPVQAFGSLLNSFAATPTVKAADTYVSPFGVDQYGYDPNDPVFNDDPGAYWAACGEENKAQVWGDTGQLNVVTQQIYHTQSNGCMLLESTAGAVGAFYSDEVLNGTINR